LPTTSATEGTATVSVVATSADGRVMEKGSFTVSLAEPPPPPKIEVGEDISAFIVLIGVSPRSDGTTWARICDNANRSRYQIDASKRGVKVVKEEILIPRRGWQEDEKHSKNPAGVMHISDSKSGTNRLFKIIAVDYDGLIIADLKPDHAPPAKPAMGMGPPGPPRPGPPKQGHANPMAALGGNMIAAVPQPKYYRWPVGSSLAGLKVIPDDEAKKILKQAEIDGPVPDVATVKPNP